MQGPVRRKNNLEYKNLKVTTKKIYSCRQIHAEKQEIATKKEPNQ